MNWFDVVVIAFITGTVWAFVAYKALEYLFAGNTEGWTFQLRGKRFYKLGKRKWLWADKGGWGEDGPLPLHKIQVGAPAVTLVFASRAP